VAVPQKTAGPLIFHFGSSVITSKNTSWGRALVSAPQLRRQWRLVNYIYERFYLLEVPGLHSLPPWHTGIIAPLSIQLNILVSAFSMCSLYVFRRKPLHVLNPSTTSKRSGHMTCHIFATQRRSARATGTAVHQRQSARHQDEKHLVNTLSVGGSALMIYQTKEV